MTFHEYWQEQQAQEAVVLRSQIEQAQSWVGCRVRIAPLGLVVGSVHPTYGEIESIDGRGGVNIVVGYDASGRPRCHGSHVSCLGQSVTLVDG